MVKLRHAHGGFLKALFSPFKQKIDDLLRTRERPISGEENVDVRRLEFADLGGQSLDELLQRAGFDEAHADRLPFQMGDFIPMALVVIVVVVVVIVDYAVAGRVVANLLQVHGVHGTGDPLLAPVTPSWLLKIDA